MATEPTPGTGTEPTPIDPSEPSGETPDDLASEVEKWKRLSRQNEAQAKANADAAKRLKELEDADKTELEKLTGKLTTTEQELTGAKLTVLRMEVALDKAPEGMSIAQVRKLAKRLDGTTREELESDADELFSEFVTDDTKPVTKKPAADLKRGGPEGVSQPEDPLLATLKAKVGAS